MRIKKIILYTCLPILLLTVACIKERDEDIRQKLDIILADDMEAILEGIDTSALLDKPYHKIVEYNMYDEGPFSRLAVVDFYFFNTIDKKIRRKYRYYKRSGLWDRYYNKWYTTDKNETDK